MTARDRIYVAFAGLVVAMFLILGFASGLPVILGAGTTAALFVVGMKWLPSTRRPRNAAQWIGPVWAVLFLSTLGFDYALNAGDAEAVRHDLENESSSVPAMPGSREISHSSSTKPHQALVGNSYTTALSWADIRSYYDRALASAGWTFAVETPVRDWGKDLGGRNACYRKGAYRTHVQYAGAAANYGWDFAVDMSWGLSDCGE